MVLTGPNDISIVLSGGSINLDPNASLGGEPSATPITSNVINNLFADASSDQTASGYINYRAIYLFNDGSTPIYNIKLWSVNTSSSIIELGIQDNNETQRITITGSPTGGNFTLTYANQELISNYNSNLGLWASTLQTQLEALEINGEPIFNSLTVIAQNATSGNIIFDITFSGIDGMRNFNAFFVNNNLTPITTSVFVTIPQVGSPINTIAPELNVETTPPGGVAFLATSQGSPITVPVLNPTDGFPLWIQRTIPAGMIALENDNFVLYFQAQSLPQG